MKLVRLADGFRICDGAKILLESSRTCPMIYVGRGQEKILMYRGNFKIDDYLTERRPLSVTGITEMPEEIRISFEDVLEVRAVMGEHSLSLYFKQTGSDYNRFWLRVRAVREEHCYGLGEQFSYFDLRGRDFPLWTSEPGVGRDKSTYITFQCDRDSMSGGDYYNTNFPQPTFISSEKYYLHTDSTAYGIFDFSHEDFHELQLWEVPAAIYMETAKTFPQLEEKLTARLGRPQPLPDWIYNGVIIGLQGGTERTMALTEKTLAAGIPVCGVWCQDWEGKRVTSFGDRLQWDWRWNEQRYPQLPEKMAELKARGIRFLGYINPYLVNDGLSFQEGEEKGYYCKGADGKTCLIDFGEFYCGGVDLTNPEAFHWFKELIKKNLIDFGLDGWMADFGEYLPADSVLANGSAMTMHNHWPALWARCNYEALEETGKLGEIVYFMRAGGTGSQKYCTLLWAGDQSVDFSIHDGLASVIPAALSAGISGCGITHSDIGGYTSLYDNCRSKELFLRWADMNIFTPVMRTHESNRPAANFQYYDDAEAMAVFARQTQIHVMLKPYLKAMVAECAGCGMPVQRPLFMHYDQDPECFVIQTSYLLGPDLLVAPVYLEGQTERELYLPEDTWIHLWTGREYGPGTVRVGAPIGYTPVFYRKASPYRGLFEEIRASFGGGFE